MPGEKVSQLPETESANDGDLVYIVQSGQSKKITVDNLVGEGGGGGGDGVSGPESSTDSGLALWNGTNGDTLKDCTITVGADNNVSNIGFIKFTAANTVIYDVDGNEFLSFGRAANAINFITIGNAESGQSPTIAATTQFGGDSDADLRLLPLGNGSIATNTFILFESANKGFKDENDNEILVFPLTANAVNYLTVRPSATGSPVIVQSAGDDSGVDLTIQCQGSGKIQLNSNTEILHYLKLRITDTDGMENGQVWYDDSEGKIKYHDGTNVQTVAIE